MSHFTTRPEIRGTFGVVASTHWLASSVGMAVLERGGNAFDAAVAAGFTLQIVEPHLNGPGGDVPILFNAAGEDMPRLLCGQGVAPAGASIAHYRSEGLDIMPATGHLAAVVPGSFAAWMTLLRDYGTMEVADVLAPAIAYARDGYPLVPRIVEAIASVEDLFRRHWPSSAAIYLPGGALPSTERLFRNPVIADTWDRVIAETNGAATREARIDSAIRIFHEGFIAEAMTDFVREPVLDSSGHAHAGVLTMDDMAAWRPGYETPLSLAYGDFKVFKGGPWSQGPVFLQQLALLKTVDIAAMDPNGPDFVHTIIEAAKLAFADREAYYGDPDWVDVPIAALLGDDYNRIRAALMSDRASYDLVPGAIDGYTARLPDLSGIAAATAPGTVGGAGEPTMAQYSKRALEAATGDTCHVDVIDRHGNMVAATPSGGWLQSSPVVPELGFGLTTRAQMFWLEDGLPASLAPGKRPRSTLSPSLAHRDGKPYMVWGTPGGDQQDQWTVTQFLRHADHGMNLQEAVDAPLFHSAHFPSSFYPRQAQPGRLVVEERLGAKTIADLEARGHDVAVDGPWTIGRMCAASRDGDMLKAAATPRGMQGYAVGR
ncbi:MAG: gamma-glutamyltransferase family protein [Pseudomonadota bacterium]